MQKAGYHLTAFSRTVKGIAGNRRYTEFHTAISKEKAQNKALAVLLMRSECAATRGLIEVCIAREGPEDDAILPGATSPCMKQVSKQFLHMRRQILGQYRNGKVRD